MPVRVTNRSSRSEHGARWPCLQYGFLCLVFMAYMVIYYVILHKGELMERYFHHDHRTEYAHYKVPPKVPVPPIIPSSAVAPPPIAKQSLRTANEPFPEKTPVYFPRTKSKDMPAPTDVRSLVHVWSEDQEMAFPTAFGSRNLILGLAFNIDEKHLSIFAASLRASRCNAIVILFLNFQPEGLVAEVLSKHFIHAVIVDVAVLLPEALRKFHPSSLRWVLYDRLLHALVLPKGSIRVQSTKHVEALYHGAPLKEMFNELFDKVIVLDVRDTAFQDDPFTLLPALQGQYADLIHSTAIPEDQHILHTLYVTGEDEGLPIAQCGWNSAWIRDCFSDEILSWVGQNPVSCSGVSFGYNHVVVAYVHFMAMVLQGQPIQFQLTNKVNNKYTMSTDLSAKILRPKAKQPQPDVMVVKDAMVGLNHRNRLPGAERNGVDQGVHNTLLYLNAFSARVVYPHTFPVINVQSALNTMGFFLDTDNKMLKMMDGRPFAIVHQYDRLMELQNMFIALYVPWIDLTNIFSEWDSSSDCKSFSHMKDMDMLRGMCDAGSQRVMTLASCCELCNKRSPHRDNSTRTYANSICTGFTYAGGQCYFKKCTAKEVTDALRVAQSVYSKSNPFKEPGAVTAYLSL